MSENKQNPGKAVLWIGTLVSATFVFGVAAGLETPHGQPPVPGLIAAGVILAVTIFVASVVGVYYAGKEKP